MRQQLLLVALALLTLLISPCMCLPPPLTAGSAPGNLRPAARGARAAHPAQITMYVLTTTIARRLRARQPPRPASRFACAAVSVRGAPALYAQTPCPRRSR